MLRQEARQAALKLLKTGTRPTRKRVYSLITKSPIKLFKLIMEEIRKLEKEQQRPSIYPRIINGTL